MITRIKIVEKNNGAVYYVAQVFKVWVMVGSILSFPFRVSGSLFVTLVNSISLYSESGWYWCKYPIFLSLKPDYSHREYETTKDEYTYSNIGFAKKAIDRYLEQIQVQNTILKNLKKDKKDQRESQRVKKRSYLKYP